MENLLPASDFDQPQAFDLIAEALFGRTRLRVLGLLFGQPERSFYLREISRETGSGLGGVQRELGRLAVAGIVTRRPDGKQVYFTANPHSPVYEELRRLLAKTAGIANSIRSALEKLHVEHLIDAAFIYGSVATATQKADSDVDILVVGEVKLTRLVQALQRLQSRLGREINPSVYRREEFRMKYVRGDHFVRRVMERPKIMVTGTRYDLAELVGEPLAR